MHYILGEACLKYTCILVTLVSKYWGAWQYDFLFHLMSTFSGPDPHLCRLLQKSERPKRSVLQCQSNDRGSPCYFCFAHSCLFSCSTEKKRGRHLPSITQTIQSLSRASSFSAESKVLRIMGIIFILFVQPLH